MAGHEAVRKSLIIQCATNEALLLCDVKRFARRHARAQLSLRFTDEQKAELLRARRTYFVRMGPLLQERATIQSRLQARHCSKSASWLANVFASHQVTSMFCEAAGSTLVGFLGRVL